MLSSRVGVSFVLLFSFVTCSFVCLMHFVDMCVGVLFVAFALLCQICQMCFVGRDSLMNGCCVAIIVCTLVVGRCF